MLSMELQPTMHIQHINHHGIVGTHGLTSLSSQAGQHHSGLLHHQHAQQQQQQHHSMLEDKQSKSELVLSIILNYLSISIFNHWNLF